MKIAVVGANGFIGRNLVDALLGNNNEVIALSRSAQNIPISNSNLTKVNVDIFDKTMMTKGLKGCQVAYYLVHMMGQKNSNFAEAEAEAAKTFAKSAKKANVKRIVYLGGLGDDEDGLSEHLNSRHNTGEILRAGKIQVIELRASIIVGKGSISFDIITNLIKKLPVLTLPKWAETKVQPIGLDDTLQYLVDSATVDTKSNQIVEIGGPEQMSYKDFMKRYSQHKGYRRWFIELPIIPVSVASWWLNLFTPRKHAKVGREMVESLAFPMVVNDSSAMNLFPKIKPKRIERYLN